MSSSNSLNINIKRGTTLNPVVLVLYSDDEGTERTPILGSSPIALVKDDNNNLILDLGAEVKPAGDYWPEVADELGDPLDGEVIVFSLTSEETQDLVLAGYKWDIVNEYENEEVQFLFGGRFIVKDTESLD